MAKVQIYHSAAQNRGLPPICMCCGAPAALYQRAQFIWTPLWAVLIGPLGTWFYWRVKMDGPLCGEHRYHWTWRWVLPLCMLVLGLGLCAGSYIYLDITRRKVAAAPLHKWIYIGAAIAFVLWFILLQIFRHSGVHPIHVDDRGITFTGVADAFKDAVENPAPRTSPGRVAVPNRAIAPEVLTDDEDEVLDVPWPNKPPGKKTSPR